MSAPRPRALLACRGCARQWDVTHLETGARVRCEYGLLLEVEAPVSRAARPNRCGNCGGVLPVDARACTYCEAEITLEERRLSGICPVCRARLAADARFCMECGTRIEPQALRAVPEGRSCPRCRSGLRARLVGPSSFVECPGCGGLWLPQEELERICSEEDRANLVRAHLAGPVSGSAESAATGPSYLPCPTCGDRMVRRNFGGCSGVLIDVCRGHGTWLDHRELERVLKFVRGGGLLRAREREVERLRAEADRARAGWPGPSTGFDPGPDEAGAGDLDLGDVLRWIGRHVRRRAS